MRRSTGVVKVAGIHFPHEGLEEALLVERPTIGDRCVDLRCQPCEVVLAKTRHFALLKNRNEIGPPILQVSQLGAECMDAVAAPGLL